MGQTGRRGATVQHYRSGPDKSALYNTPACQCPVCR